MISVSEATQIVLSNVRDYGVEQVPFLQAQGRILAENIGTDRDLPPYDRVTMDGIAIRYDDYAAGCRQFRIVGTQAAGAIPLSALDGGSGGSTTGTPQPGLCLEIMTGAAMSPVVDTVVPYENLHISHGIAHVQEGVVKKGQNIHRQGSDRQQGDVVMTAGQIIGPTHISMAAAVGKSMILVKKLPRIVVVSSGDELVDVLETPLPHQIRRSNNYAMFAVLQHYGAEVVLRHLPDDPAVIQQEIAQYQRDFDVILLSGGVSMGKFDYIPQALEAVGVRQHLHKVRQRPGKPFWFGTFGPKGVVFALPGNPVSTFLCLHQYVLPWLETSLGFPTAVPEVALLSKFVRFEPQLTYFIQVQLKQDQEARWWAAPLEGHGSGDFANLVDARAFMKLPPDRSEFQAGEAFPLLRFKGN